MAQTKAKASSEIAEPSKPAIAKNGSAITGHAVKFIEAVKCDKDAPHVSYVTADTYNIKLLPNGWCVIARKVTPTLKALVPSTNISYFLPSDDV